MKNVMHFELLKVAHSLVDRGQNVAYWTNVRVPLRPLGVVRFEVARQVATFAVPLAGLGWAYMHYALGGLVLGVPVAWFIGYLLDQELRHAINSRCRLDERIDAGRYRAVNWLSKQMGMRPEDITLDVIAKMDRDYIIVKGLLDEMHSKHDADVQAAKAASRRRRSLRDTVESDHSTMSTTRCGNTDTVYADRDDDYNWTGGYNHMPSYNPASGLPMVGNTFVDVGGNAYGTDNHTF